MNNLVERLHAYVGEDVTTRADRLIKEAADEIERLTAKLKAYDNPRQTHSEKCWARHGHSECAVREIERLTGSNNRLHVNGTADGLRIDDLTFENTKLRAVVDAAKRYEAERCYDTWLTLRQALAALETE